MWGFRATLYEGEGGALCGALLPVTVFLAVKVTGEAALARWDRILVGVDPGFSSPAAHHPGRLRGPGGHPTHAEPGRQPVDQGDLGADDAGATHLHTLDSHHDRVACPEVDQALTQEVAGQGAVGGAGGGGLGSSHCRTEVPAPDGHPCVTCVGGEHRQSVGADAAAQVRNRRMVRRHRLDGGQVDLLLDLAVPDTETDGPRPLLVHIHGGGFTEGSRWPQWDWAARGWVAASIDYRLAGDDPLPGPRVQGFFDAVGGKSAPTVHRSVIAAVEDTLVALDYLLGRADELRIDTDRIVLKGESAGAFTALHVAYCADEFGIDHPTIAAVVDFSGAIARTCGEGAAIDPSEAALFVAHGTEEVGETAFSRAENIVAGATAAGITYEFHPLEGVGHSWLLGMFGQTAADGRKIDDLMYEFLDRVLYGGYVPTTTVAPTTTTTAPTTTTAAPTTTATPTTTTALRFVEPNPTLGTPCGEHMEPTIDGSTLGGDLVQGWGFVHKQPIGFAEHGCLVVSAADVRSDQIPLWTWSSPLLVREADRVVRRPAFLTLACVHRLHPGVVAVASCRHRCLATRSGYQRFHPCRRSLSSGLSVAPMRLRA